MPFCSPLIRDIDGEEEELEEEKEEEEEEGTKRDKERVLFVTRCDEEEVVDDDRNGRFPFEASTVFGRMRLLVYTLRSSEEEEEEEEEEEPEDFFRENKPLAFPKLTPARLWPDLPMILSW